ncbi:MAG TPA: LuxR C-terminal-related transcriptional regulator [Trebonia sp.]|nr:LuxR C-terminal-related transcriptional regulator [Trebonia sp.]
MTEDGLSCDLPATTDSKVRDGFDLLTHRQRTILELLARGLSNPQIGRELHLSRYTVAHHVAEMLRRVGATNRVDLVTRAHLAGALPANSA